MINNNKKNYIRYYETCYVLNLNTIMFYYSLFMTVVERGRERESKESTFIKYRFVTYVCIMYTNVFIYYGSHMQTTSINCS